MKRKVTARFAIIMLAIAFSTILVQAQTLSFSLDTVVADPGSNITVSVYANNLDDVGAISLFINFSTIGLTYLGAGNWHPSFDNAYNLVNAAGGLVGIIWFDTAGITTGGVKLLDLYFQHKNGSTALTFNNQCEIANSQGVVISPVNYHQGLVVPALEVSLGDPVMSICAGGSTSLSAQVSGGIGNTVYEWFSIPPGLNASTPSVNISPLVATTYFVAVHKGGQSDTASILVDFFADPPLQPVGGMIPADSTIGLDQAVSFSWMPVANALLYDLFLWKEGSPEPSTPVRANLSQISTSVSSLSYDSRYYWRVRARNNCFDTTGPVHTFTVLALPELHVVSMNHSLSKNGQAIQVTWTVRNDGNGPTTTPTWYDRIWITPDIDLRIGEPEDVLLGTYTNPVALAPGQSYTQTKTIPLPKNYIGTYFLFALTDVMDAIISFDPNATFPNDYNPPPYLFAYSHGGAGVNLVREPNDNSPWYDNFFYKEITFPVPPLPDLQVNSVAAPISTFSGQSITVNWTVENHGDASSGLTNWVDKVYFSSDSILDNSDVYLGFQSTTVSNPGGLLNPDSSYSASKSFAIPNFIQGDYYIIVYADANNALYEHAFDENNTNVSAAINVILTPPPDLIVSSVTAPDSASNREVVNIKWSVANQGATGPIKLSWFDAVYLSPSPSFEDPGILHLGDKRVIVSSLNPGAFYSEQLNVTIPAAYNGDYYFFVRTNYKGDVFEFTADTNNHRAAPGATRIVSPDLTPASLLAPPLNLDGTGFQLSWTIQNLGPGDLLSTSWYEKIFLSPTPLYQEGFSTQVRSKKITQNIPAGGSAPASDSVFLPYDLVEGNFFLHVVSDATNSVYEHGMESNNVSLNPALITILRPDLQVAGIQHPDTGSSGQPINLSWYDKNAGGGTVSGSWVDKVYISASPLYNTSNLILLATFTHNSTISGGDSLWVNNNVTLPNGVNGLYYFYIHTDFGQQIPEGARDGNNITRSPNPVFIQLSPYADLVPDSIIRPDTAWAGTYIDVGMRVRNLGAFSALGNSWQDRILVGTHANPEVGNPSSLLTFTRNTPLLPDSSYTWSGGAQLPVDLSQGQYYIIGKTDENNQIYEYIGDANNFLGRPFYVMGYPLDMEAQMLSWTADSLNSMQSFSFQWTAGNIGVVKTVTNHWYDAVYLSQDTLFNPASDILVKEHKVSGPVLPGANYSKSASSLIPYGLDGNYYVFLVIDNGQVSRDIQRSNNILLGRDGSGNPKPLHITELPSPDLVVSDLIVPAQIFSGQAYKIKWTVRNQGLGTATAPWWDKFYLSTDFAINQGDKNVVNKFHTSNLGPGDSYTDSVEVISNFDQTINYILIASTDHTQMVPEYNGENNNTLSVFTAASIPPPTDLIISGMDAEDTLIAGTVMPIFWTLKNIGTNQAKGNSTDGFYISIDNTLDNNDFLFESQAMQINIQAGDSLEKQILSSVPAVPDGDYYLIGAADIKNTIFETNDTNNLYISGPHSLSLPILPLNVHVLDTIQNLEYKHWRIDIPDSLIGETILIELKGDSITGNNEMFYALNRVPTKIDYDRRHANFFRGNQELVIPEVFPGKHYLTITGISGLATEQEIELYARKLNFEIRHYDPQEGGNLGNVTMQIDGSKFTPGMILRLVDPTRSRPDITALSVQYVDPSRAFATLVLDKDDYVDDYGRTLTAPGVFDLYLIKPGIDTVIIPNGFEIVPGSGENLLINIQHPPSVRPNRFLTMSIQYANAGNNDIIHPEAALMSMGGAPIGITLNDLQYGIQDLVVEFSDPNGPPGILRPGSFWTVHIYTKSTHPLHFKLIRINQ